MTENTIFNNYSKVGNRSQGRPGGTFFSSYYTELLGRTLLLSMDCSTLPLIRTFYCWVLSKEVSSTIFKVFDTTWHGIEPRSPGPFANTSANYKKLLFSIFQIWPIQNYMWYLMNPCSNESALLRNWYTIQMFVDFHLIEWKLHLKYMR